MFLFSASLVFWRVPFLLKPIPLEKDFLKNPAMPMKMISVLNKLETLEVLDHHCFMVFGLHASPFKKKRYSTRMYKVYSLFIYPSSKRKLLNHWFPFIPQESRYVLRNRLHLKSYSFRMGLEPQKSYSIGRGRPDS